MNKENTSKIGANATTTGAAMGKKDDRKLLGNLHNHFPGSDPSLVEFVTELAYKGLIGLSKGEHKRHFEVAKAITDALVEKYGGAWHTIVGKSYGSFVSHEQKNLVYISIGQVIFLTFKHG